MLNIKIVNGNHDGSLNFEVNGAPGGADNGAKKGWRVHWKVHPECNVAYIHDIKIKTGSGAPPSTDIFSNDPPSPQGGPHSTHWRGTVNSTASVGEEYNYYIQWMPKGGVNVKTFDPKISVMPSFRLDLTHISLIILSLVGIFSIGLFLKKKKGKNFFKKFR